MFDNPPSERSSGRIPEQLLNDLRVALRAQIAELAVHFLGQPNKSSRRSTWWRWGRNDGMAVCVSGPNQGACKGFSGNGTGDPLKFIGHQLHCDFVAAVRFGCDFVGIPFDQQGRQETPEERDAREEKRRREQEQRDGHRQVNRSRNDFP